MRPQMHLHILASGSKGNATVVEGPTGSVLIDDGLSRRELMRRADELGVDMNRVECVVITHEHSDHVSGLTVFCNRYEGRLVAPAGTAGGRKYLAELPFELVGNSDEFEAGGMRIRTFPTSHDVVDPFGLRFDCGEGENADAIGYCTDTGELSERAYDLLYNVRILALESNHDARMLDTGPYPAYLKERVAGSHGHLSNDQAAEALRTLVAWTQRRWWPCTSHRKTIGQAWRFAHSPPPWEPRQPMTPSPRHARQTAGSPSAPPARTSP